LSNIAEMKLEDAELLRIVANQLLEANEKDLAIETLREILKMREEEPQSYRDLALALSETGNYNEAVELLYKLITGTWDERFGDVKAIAINELNAIISAHKDQMNTSAVDPRFIYPMPVDVRIVIAWNTDNSDIDLWITDPRNEKCYYEHTETEIGGKISKDVTAGYGPEEFCLRKAWKGNYKVEVNLFGDSRQTLGGPIAIKAEMFTDFGKPTQKREVINFRVTTNKEVIQLGSLKFRT
jgi:tetratricopeptide (TPR) repeat protein